MVLEVTWEGASGKHQARTSDISTGGCYVDTLGSASAGEVIKLKLLLPTGQWLPLEGEVIYQMYPTGFALRFINLSEKARIVLSWLVVNYQSKHS